MKNWRIVILDRFHVSARLHAPPGSLAARALRATIDALHDGPRPDDSHHLMPPCLHARARYVQDADLIVVYDVVRIDTIRVHAVVPRSIYVPTE